MRATATADEQRYAELQARALDFARDGDAEALAPMLDHGLPVNLSDAQGNSLLMLASYHGNVDAVGLLLARGAAVDRRNDRGQTPLGGVAFKGYDAVADLLLRHGADPGADTGGGVTPILLAALFGRTRMVERLQRHRHPPGPGGRRRFPDRLLVPLARAVGALRRLRGPKETHAL